MAKTPMSIATLSRDDATSMHITLARHQPIMHNADKNLKTNFDLEII